MTLKELKLAMPQTEGIDGTTADTAIIQDVGTNRTMCRIDIGNIAVGKCFCIKLGGKNGNHNQAKCFI